MTKDSLIAFISEKARISSQRAELVYDAFWEAILSELKTGHFSLPVGKGTLQIRSKTPSPTASKEPVKKPLQKLSSKSKPVVKEKVKVKVKTKSKSTSSPAKSKKTVAKKSAKKKKK